VIHHGFKLNIFSEVEDERISAIRNKYRLQNVKPIIGVISRYLELKGIHYIIQAFTEIQKKYPSAHIILANAKGNYSQEIKKLLHKLPEKSYTEILFEEDLAALYQVIDIHVHVPIDSQCEAFGQTYVEALASGVPSVFTLSGVAPEFIQHEQNALVVPFQNSKAISEAVIRVLDDAMLQKNLIEKGRLSVKIFSEEKMVLALENLYSH
jgi:glycosyltransferase involved in cell wall biosynthesis